MAYFENSKINEENLPCKRTEVTKSNGYNELQKKGIKIHTRGHMTIHTSSTKTVRHVYNKKAKSKI